MAEFLVDDRVDDVHVGDTAVAAPHLVAVDDPIVAVAARAGAQVPYVAATFGLRDRQRRELEITWGAETFGRPFQHLLGRGGLTDRRERQRRHDDRQTDSRATPKEFLHEHRPGEPARITDQIAIEQRAVEAALSRL